MTTEGQGTSTDTAEATEAADITEGSTLGEQVIACLTLVGLAAVVIGGIFLISHEIDESHNTLAVPDTKPTSEYVQVETALTATAQVVRDAEPGSEIDLRAIRGDSSVNIEFEEYVGPDNFCLRGESKGGRLLYQVSGQIDGVVPFC